MPLSSNHLSSSIITTLREIPKDNESLPNQNYPYQTQVSIYDDKCGGCGYVYIEAQPSASWHDAKEKKIFRNIKDAINYASQHRCFLKRSCCYPSDVFPKNGDFIYPSLIEIISNTCKFWDSENLLLVHDAENDIFINLEEK